MKRLILLIALSAALLAPAGALASGVVLNVQPSSHLVAVTRSATRVALVHTSAAARLHVGQRVALTARTLRNGTLSAAQVRVVGRAHTVRFRGLLLAKTRTSMLVSAGGAVISIRGAPARRPRHVTAARSRQQVDVQATVGTTDELDAEDVTSSRPTAPGGAIEGHADARHGNDHRRLGAHGARSQRADRLRPDARSRTATRCSRSSRSRPTARSRSPRSRAIDNAQQADDNGDDNASGGHGGGGDGGGGNGGGGDGGGGSG